MSQTEIANCKFAQAPHANPERAPGDRRSSYFQVRFAISLVPVLSFLISSPLVPAASFDPVDVDLMVAQSLRAWKVPGCAVAIVRGGKVVYLKGFGVREWGKRESVTPDTLFPIGSCTKAFTTAGMAMLVDEGKMAWDDPVRKHLPYFHLYDPVADTDVRLRDLLTHRTGVGSHDFLWYHSPLSIEEQVRRVAKLPPQWPFRARFQYQTTMFDAAGLALAHAAGQGWDNFVQRRILDPLGMNRTFLTTVAAENDANHASAHRLNPNEEAEVIPWYSMHRPDPAGSMCTSARDLSRWLEFQLGDGTWAGKRLVSRKNLDEMHTPQMVIRLEGKDRDMHPDTVQMTYGLAWVIQDYRGQRLVSHAGAIDGFRAHVTMVPQAGIGIVLLNNLDQTQMNLALSNTLVDYLLGLPAKDWNAYLTAQVRKQHAAREAQLVEREGRRHRDTHPAHPPAAYAGTYFHPAYGKCQVRLEDGVLVWKWHGFTGPLEHFEFETFTMRNERLGNPQIVFHSDRSGRVDNLRVQELLGVTFCKIEDKSGK